MRHQHPGWQSPRRTHGLQLHLLPHLRRYGPGRLPHSGRWRREHRPHTTRDSGRNSTRPRSDGGMPGRGYRRRWLRLRERKITDPDSFFLLPEHSAMRRTAGCHRRSKHHCAASTLTSRPIGMGEGVYGNEYGCGEAIQLRHSLLNLETLPASILYLFR